MLDFVNIVNFNHNGASSVDCMLSSNGVSLRQPCTAEKNVDDHFFFVKIFSMDHKF